MIQSMEIFRFFRKKQIKVFSKTEKVCFFDKNLIQSSPPQKKPRIFPENQIVVFRNHNNSGFSMVMYYRFRKYLGFSSRNQFRFSKYLKSTFLTKMCPFFLTMAEQYLKTRIRFSTTYYKLVPCIRLSFL